MTMENTDDADPKTVLKVLQFCAKHWVPEARLVGNVMAGDIVAALDIAIPLMPKPKPKRCTRTIEMFEVAT